MTRPTLAQQLARQGISRRAFLKFCAATASMMALPPTMAPAIAEAWAGVPGRRSSGCRSRNAPAVPSP
ncbi:twin-arginine translocation signal domain-containing protein [Thiohalobacter thiocyanaticus]|uniref:twin-arginine translocation signal domain-containing protein n=1 Tax=Thiohalobacter thiocyanaticus TaxID=585455 RepID=UPI001F4E1753|nr:twin-arginine translocation signal domain-containing protein [Thiohalobacter thiocyanaticus]